MCKKLCLPYRLFRDELLARDYIRYGPVDNLLSDLITLFYRWLQYRRSYGTGENSGNPGRASLALRLPPTDGALPRLWYQDRETFWSRSRRGRKPRHSGAYRHTSISSGPGCSRCTLLWCRHRSMSSTRMRHYKQTHPPRGIRANGLTHLQITKDLAGHDRIVSGEM